MYGLDVLGDHLKTCMEEESSDDDDFLPVRLFRSSAGESSTSVTTSSVSSASASILIEAMESTSGEPSAATSDPHNVIAIEVRLTHEIFVGIM